MSDGIEEPRALTVVLYISPASLMAPVIITDTVTSDANGDVIGKIATRHRDFDNGSTVDFNSLARKTIIPNSATAVAFAGSLDSIEDFLTYVPILVDDLSSERPLRLLAERAGQYSKGKVNIISILRPDNVDGLHKVKPDYCVESEIDNLGYFAAIGSGAETLKARMIELFNIVKYDGVPDWQAALLIANTLCIDVLAQEIYNQLDGVMNQTWGGLLEYIYFNPVKRSWLRQPSTAYFFYQLDILGDKISSPMLIDRIFLYEPGYESGWLHAIRSGPENSYNISYRLKAVYPNDGGVKTLIWSNWRPKQVNLCIVAGSVDGKHYNLNNRFFGSYDVDEECGVTMQMGRTGVRFLPYGHKLEEFLNKGIRATVESIRTKQRQP